jgi:hypothetical protein
MRWKETALKEAARAVELGAPADPIAKRWYRFTWAGEPDAALKQIEIFLSLPSAYKPNNFRLDPVWDPIRRDPRFEKVLEGKRK